MPESELPVVRVRGAATRRFAADSAVLHVSVERASGTDRTEALARAAAAAETLRAALADAPGVREVALSGAGVHEAAPWHPGGPEQAAPGWVASLVGLVTVDAGAAGEVLAVVAAAEVTVSGVGWALDDAAAARRETRIAAVAAAREAAEDLAEAAGRELGDLRVLADPGLSGPPPHAGGLARFAVASAAPVHVDLDPQPVEVTAEVEATYTLV